ncbi:hypothetical protein V2J09_009898 [Rumex salicifolius]
MASNGNQNQEKPDDALGYTNLKSENIKRRERLALRILRVVAIFATLSATIVMALNKETKTIVVATIGTTPIKATLVAKFQDTPANIFFVFANGLATFHNLLMLILEIFGGKLDKKGFRFIVVPILDTVMLALVSAGASSAAFMSDLAKRGNSHAQWNKICDKFDTFCSHGGGALLASFIGIAILLVICILPKLQITKEGNSNSTFEA